MKIIRRIWDYAVIAMLMVLSVIDDIRESGWEDPSDDK